MVALALEGEDGVDHVLQHARTGEPALLGDVAHEHHGDVAALGLLHEPVRAPAHLHDRARCAAEVGVDHGLDGVDDDETGEMSSIAFTMCASDISGSSHNPSFSAPRRSARERTCWALSSAVT